MSYLSYSLLSQFNIPRFDIDTDETIRQRIADKVKTIPEWVSLSDDDDRKVYILKNQVTNSMNSKDTFDGFVQRHFNGQISTNPYNLDSTTIAKYWLSVQKKIDDYDIIFIAQHFLKHNINMVGDMTEDRSQYIIKTFYDTERERFMKELDLSVKFNSNRASSFLKYQEKMATLSSQQHFRFQQEKVNLLLKTNVKEKEKSLSTIFANIVCDQHAPLFSYNDIYKVVDDLPFLLPLLGTNNEEWALSSDIIRGYISHV
jgi:hypothetical protein